LVEFLRLSTPTSEELFAAAFISYPVAQVALDSRGTSPESVQTPTKAVLAWSFA